MGEPARLTPTMRSRKLQALDFIKRFMARWGKSPSLSEIAAGLEISKQRAGALVHDLATDEMIRVVKGKARGIELIDQDGEMTEADLLLLLARRGWLVVQPRGPGGESIGDPLTKTGLLELPILDHKPQVDTGDGQDGKSEGQGRAA